MTHFQKIFIGSGLGLAGLMLIFLAHIQPAAADLTSSIPDLPDQAYNYANQTLPAYYTNGPVAAADNTPANNPITDAGATLGRVLFYDKTLSANGTIACASCHIQEEGFSDNRQFSVGFDGELTGRNSMGLANGRFYTNGHFFWDERAATLEDQVLEPFQSEVEMGLTLEELVTLVESQSYYEPLFTDAFGSTEVTSEKISLALAQFVRAMSSTDSKYDQVLRGEATFTAEEELGQQIFMEPNQGNCAACHGTDAHIAPEARNIGLDIVYTDNGVGEVTGNTADDGKFKVPSLRNVALTAPYMHDGRFATLQEVVRFYNNSVEAHPNLDPALQNDNGDPRRLRLNQEERQALVAFLETLTDQSLSTDPKFSDPFVEVQQPATETIYLPLITR